ncbi:30S ribosomal protein S13 [endosymbiont of Euscepes postfasciatus]|uniref:30S ribosomal protein S13 n=1 Tax=endosymbiont of Euscepes postfasciatus TaxID=650377 RepID=UPI000DC71FBA|nr:30S ribosomal protein S13 [endosymbiont of Euscepes postfasciatus]BBA84672.1 30S ribosomal protein S13 [endosymbiont of Euscepes postfasciatus]
MIRIYGVNIPDNKQILIALTYIFGIGISTSRKICNKLNIKYSTKICDIDSKLIDEIRKEISYINIEGDLKKNILSNIKRLINIGSYRGIRHKRGLPTRGQRTKTNAKTRKKYKIF